MTDTAQRRRGLRQAARSGVIAWLIGVGVALLLWLLFASSSGGPIAFIASAVVFYYSFHLWPAVPLLTAGEPIFAIFAPIPVLLLFWAGFRTAVNAGVASAAEGVRRGGSVIVGYFAMAVLSLPLFAFSVGQSPLADPLGASFIVGVTGIAFPIVFGGLGGWIAGR